MTFMSYQYTIIRVRILGYIQENLEDSIMAYLSVKSLFAVANTQNCFVYLFYLIGAS